MRRPHSEKPLGTQERTALVGRQARLPAQGFEDNLTTFPETDVLRLHRALQQSGEHLLPVPTEPKLRKCLGLSAQYFKRAAMA